jgi:hypothetical protein
LIFASIALALTAARRLNNAIVAWTDLQDLTTYRGWRRDVGASGGRLDVGLEPMVPASVAKHRCVGCSAGGRGIIGAVIHSARVTRGSRLASIALFVVIGARIVRSGPMRILALVTLASIHGRPIRRRAT